MWTFAMVRRGENFRSGAVQSYEVEPQKNLTGFYLEIESSIVKFFNPSFQTSAAIVGLYKIEVESQYIIIVILNEKMPKHYLQVVSNRKVALILFLH